MVENGMDIDRQRIGAVITLVMYSLYVCLSVCFSLVNNNFIIGINMITIGMNITVMFRHLEEVIFQEEV